VWLGEQEHPVVELIAAVLGRVGAEASRVTGRAVDDVVMTHPASWARVRLGVLADAASRAGLGSARFVPEPVAAAAYFATTLGQRLPANRAVVVYDLGGGTFDVSVVRSSPDGVDVVASDGLTDVGGLDLDAAVVDHARSLTAGATGAWRRLDWPQTPADQQSRQVLWHAAQAVKEHLSRHSAGNLQIPLVDQQVHLTREEFENAARPYLDQTAKLTLTVLRSANIHASTSPACAAVGPGQQATGRRTAHRPHRAGELGRVQPGRAPACQRRQRRHHPAVGFVISDPKIVTVRGCGSGH
jgi:molecular chaperone DnaK (HSP70)